MITKERLEGLIEKSAVIYSEQFQETINLIETRNWDFFGDGFAECDYKTHRCLIINLERLFETKEDAEEYAEFGNITRTERLELPSWENIESIIEQKKRFGINHSDRVLARIITKDSIYWFRLCKDLDLFTFELKQTYIGEDLCEELTSRFPVSLGKVTKTNYEKARRLCVKLFKGENV